MTCFVCGNPITQNYKETRYGFVIQGRPKTYCSKECSDYLKYFNAMQKALDSIPLDDLHKRKIRGDLFRVANTIKIYNCKTFGTDILVVKN